MAEALPQLSDTLEEDDESADWIKAGWDFPGIDSAEQMRAFITGTLGMTVAHFKTLPVYKYNVTVIPWLRDL